MRKNIIFIVLTLFSIHLNSQAIFINEIHYDDGSGDINEGVEVLAPAGTDLDCYQIEVYNGSGGALYGTYLLGSSVAPDEGCGYGTVWIGISGLQNGSPDGVALVYNPSLAGCSGGGALNVVQFISYEGSFVASSGSASGQTSVDIGVNETNSTSVGTSLQLTGAGTTYSDFTWATSSSNSMASINAGQNLCVATLPSDVTYETSEPSSTMLSLSWNAPLSCSDEIVVIASLSSTFTNAPSGDGSTYLADANFGSGTDLGGGEYVVYKGSASSFNLLSLANDTEYCLKIYNRCGTNWSTGVVICGTPDNFTTELTVLAYNILNYPGSTSYRDSSFRKIVHFVNPDIIVCNEVITSTGWSNLLNAVNTFGITNYSIAPFVDGPDTDNALMYKNDILNFTGQTQITTALRNITDYTLSWPNNSGTTSTLDIFSLHLKAGNTAIDEGKRDLECQNLSTYLDAMPANSNIIVGGDFNFYDDAEPGYSELTASGTQVLYDPIDAGGAWQNNAAFANIHTQSTRSAANPGIAGGSTGGMDDRFDFLFINKFVDEGRNGVYYVNNSYDNIGNDGNKFNFSIIENLPNTDVPDSIRDALFQMSDHLPIILKIKIDYSDPLTLPVELISQSAVRNNDKVEVSWSTASELNCDYFNIQRSVNATDFETIGSVRSSGNSNFTKSYFFTDSKPTRSKCYYRIKEVDFDNKKNNFKTLSVQSIEDFSEIVIYPNPSSLNFFNIRALNIEIGNYWLDVLDLSGKLIHHEMLYISGDFVELKKEINDLKSQIYHISLYNENVKFDTKFIKM